MGWRDAVRQEVVLDAAMILEAGDEVDRVVIGGLRAQRLSHSYRFGWAYITSDQQDVVEHDVAAVTKLVVEELKLQRFTGDVTERMDNQLEAVRIFAAPDRGFFAIGEQAQPDAVEVAAGNEEGEVLVSGGGEGGREGLAGHPVSLAGVVAGQESGIGAVPDQLLSRVICVLVEVADGLT